MKPFGVPDSDLDFPIIKSIADSREATLDQIFAKTHTLSAC